MSPYNKPLSDKKTALLLYLEQKGILDELYLMGIITAKPKLMIQSRLKVVALMGQGLSKAAACSRVASLIGVDIKTIYHYLR
jgi:hypothetical protein